MEHDSEKHLEELIHRELRKLPELQAPATLILRVRSARAAQARQPWWQQPLVAWPSTPRVAFIALLAVILGLAGFFGAEISYGISFASQKVAQLFTSFTPLWQLLVALANAVLILGQTLSSHLLIYGALLLGLMYLMCIGVGTLCFRVAFANRS